MVSMHMQYYNALGALTYAFSNLEEVISRAIAELSDISEYSIAEIISSALSFRKALDVVDSLVRYQINDPRCLNELNQLIKAASRCEELRNQFIHSHWDTYVKTVSGKDMLSIKRAKVSLRRGKGMKSVLEKTPPNKILEVAKVIWNTVDKFEEFICTAGDYKNIGKWSE